MKKNKSNFGEHWIFSHMETKPTYLKKKIPVKKVRIDEPMRTRSYAESVEEFDILTAAAQDKNGSGGEEEEKG